MVTQWTILLTVVSMSALANVAMGRLSVQITQAVAKEGANVTILCRLQDPPENVIMYVAKGIPDEVSPQELIATNEELTPLYEKLLRFKVTLVQVSDAALLTLYIYGVRKDDTGVYKCLVPQLDNLAKQTTLEVYKAPNTVTFTNQTDTLLASENDSITIECGITNVAPVPPTTIAVWKNQVHRNRTSGFTTSQSRTVHCDGSVATKNCSLHYDYDVKVINHNFTFSFLDDGALLTCQPDIPQNDSGKARAEIKLSVKHIPKFACQQVVRYPLHAPDATLSCTVFSNPRPRDTDLKWGFTLEGKQHTVQPGDSQLEYEAKQPRLIEGSTYEITLVIKQVRYEHFTNYTLSVPNDLGTNTTIISLREGPHSGHAPMTSHLLLHLLNIALIIFMSRPLFH